MKTKIEWADAVWNPVRGCSRVSEGCRNCYAERIAGRFRGPGRPYAGFAQLRSDDGGKSHGARWTGRVELIPSKLDEPLHWKKPRRVFVNSMSDLFHWNLPNSVIERVFATMALASQHQFLILTKRPDRMIDWVRGERCLDVVLQHWKNRGAGQNTWPLPNVWLGVSVEDQKTADERIPLLLQTPAALRFVSYEPALGPVDFAQWLHDSNCNDFRAEEEDEYGERCTECICAEPREVHLDWLIAGGESGPGARPAHPDWFRSARDQCVAAGVPYFFKQWGEWIDCIPAEVDCQHGSQHAVVARNGTTWAVGARELMITGGDNAIVSCVGKRRAGRLLDGREWNEIPEVRT